MINRPAAAAGPSIGNLLTAWTATGISLRSDTPDESYHSVTKLRATYVRPSGNIHARTCVRMI